VLGSEDAKLVAQYEDLDFLGTISATEQDEKPEDEADKTVEASHAPILAASESRRARQRKTAGQSPSRFFGTDRVPTGDDRYTSSRSSLGQPTSGFVRNDPWATPVSP